MLGAGTGARKLITNPGPGFCDRETGGGTVRPARPITDGGEPVASAGR